MQYEFRRASSAAQTAHNVDDVYGVNTANERTTNYCLNASD